jgi:hypothetical protein
MFVAQNIYLCSSFIFVLSFDFIICPGYFEDSLFSGDLEKIKITS